MHGEESYVWAMVYASICAVHGREAAIKEADKALELYRDRQAEPCNRCGGTGKMASDEKCGRCEGAGIVQPHARW